MRIPLVDLKAQYAAIRDEIDTAVGEVVRGAVFVGGPQVESFERSFAAFCGTRHAIGVNSGTDALALALKAAGVGAGDEVVTVPNTFVATVEAIAMAGARPVFADVDERTLTMDPEALESALTPRTRAVIPVHLYGRMAAMDPILDAARRHSLIVVEDACQAHGAALAGRRSGSLGTAGAFSFYPGKNLGAFGDAGAVVTDDDRLAERVRLLRNHGRTAQYDHAVEGVNSRLDAIHAAVLAVKLRHLDAWNEARRRHAERYREELGVLETLALPDAAAGPSHVHHLFVVRSKTRDDLLAHLREGGIDAGIHYPIPLHRLAACRHLGLPEGSFPVAEAASREVLSLPLYPEMDAAAFGRVCERVRSFRPRARAAVAR